MSIYNYRIMFSLINWGWIPFYAILSYSVANAFANIQNLINYEITAIFLGYIYNVIWLIVVTAWYIYPHLNVEKYTAKNYFPLRFYDYVQLFLVVAHQIIFIILAIMAIVAYFIFPMKYNIYVDWIYTGVFFGYPIITGIAMLSGITYFIPKIYNIFRILITNTITYILSPKLIWKDLRSKLIEIFTPKEKEQMFEKLPENTSKNITQNYYKLTKRTVPNITTIPFKSTFTASMKILGDIPKTIATGKKPKP